MKPTPQISSNETTHPRLPVTDYNYQPSREATHAVVEHDAAVRESRAFWTMNAEIFRSESLHEHIGFAAIAAPSVWAIVVALHAIARMVRGF
jgi:hypothetical protein